MAEAKRDGKRQKIQEQMIKAKPIKSFPLPYNLEILPIRQAIIFCN